MQKIKITDWLEQRRLGIGGSDAATVLGLNPYKSRLQLYLEKIGEYSEKVDNRFVYWGSLHEDMVAQEFMRQTGLKVRRNNHILMNEEYPFMLGNIDRESIDNEGQHFVLECKTTNAWNSKIWDGEKIPITTIIQVVHYLIITNYDYGYIAVLIGGNDFRFKKIERDPELERMVINQENDFWVNNVEKRIPPAIDGSKASSDFLLKTFRDSIPDSTFDLKHEDRILLKDREKFITEKKTIETKIQTIDNLIKEEMEDNEIGILDNYKVSWKSFFQNRFQTKSFKEEHPKLYDLYSKESSSRRFQIRKVS